MGVISVRLNEMEENILQKLSEHFHEDRSTLIKKSLFELYENMVDLTTIDDFEKKAKKGNVSFVAADDVLKGKKVITKKST